MTAFPYGETVVVHGRVDGPPDAYGQPTFTWADLEVPGAGIAPRAGSEGAGPDRSTVIVGLTAYLPAGTMIGPRDEVTVRGERYVVDGEPGVWRSPLTGWQPGVEVALSRAEG